MRRVRLAGLHVLKNGLQVPALIRSVQRGTIDIAPASTSNTATITAVVLANTRLIWLGMWDQGANSTPDVVAARLELTNATTVTATVGGVGVGTRTVSYEVIEYVYGVIKSVQRGTFTTTANPTGNGTISSVNMGKASVDYLGFSTTFSGGTLVGQAQGMIALTSATNIRFDGTGAIDRTISYQAIEWN